jgi:sterol 3beta-glucosyltransferase
VTSVIGFGETRALRRAWGLPDLSGNPDALARESGVTMVHAFSRHLVPRHPSWGATHHVTGAFSLPADVAHRLPGAHQDASFGRWLEQGDPPVYFGLGSLPVIDMGALVALTADVCHALGLRGVVSAGSSGRDVAETPVPPNLRVIGACHHDWLFPRCRVVLHHGGSGTVHAAARAGRPQVVCSVFSDQPFWGSLVSHLGLGAHLPFRHLAPATLRDALSVALSDEVAEKAAACGGRVRSESGAVAGAAALDGRGLDRAST